MYKREADKVRPVDAGVSDGSKPEGLVDRRERDLARQRMLMLVVELAYLITFSNRDVAMKLLGIAFYLEELNGATPTRSFPRNLPKLFLFRSSFTHQEADYSEDDIREDTRSEVLAERQDMEAPSDRDRPASVVVPAREADPGEFQYHSDDE